MRWGKKYHGYLKKNTHWFVSLVALSLPFSLSPPRPPLSLVGNSAAPRLFCWLLVVGLAGNFFLAPPPPPLCLGASFSFSFPSSSSFFQRSRRRCWCKQLCFLMHHVAYYLRAGSLCFFEK